MVDYDADEKTPVKCTFDSFVLDKKIPSRSKWDHCVCSPQPCSKLCQPSSSIKSSLKSKSSDYQKSSVIGYIRSGGTQLSHDEQLKIISYYCEQHDLHLAKVFADEHKPSYGLQEALRQIEFHDALIAVNLNSFVEHEEDRVRDLRPFIHHFFCRHNKHLITIQEGLDTGTPLGQKVALDIASQVKETF